MIKLDAYLKLANSLIAGLIPLHKTHAYIELNCCPIIRKINTFFIGTKCIKNFVFMNGRIVYTLYTNKLLFKNICEDHPCLFR